MAENTVDNSVASQVIQEGASIKQNAHSHKNTKKTVGIVGAIAMIIAVAILVTTFLLPVLEVYGVSMSPTLKNGDIVVSIKFCNPQPNDLVAVQHNNKILIKRVIACQGDWVNIDQNGTVSVNGQPLNEPYVQFQSSGQTNVTFPCQVPRDHYFVLGDNREAAIDSRNTAVGFISSDQLAGKLLLRVWPLNKICVF